MKIGSKVVLMTDSLPELGIKLDILEVANIDENGFLEFSKVPGRFYNAINFMEYGVPGETVTITIDRYNMLYNAYMELDSLKIKMSIQDYARAQGGEEDGR